MESKYRAFGRSAALTLSVLLIASGLVTTQAESEAAAASTLQCASSAPVYRVLTNGNMLLYQHLEPETGLRSWDSNTPTIGRAWHNLRPAAAPDGVIYAPFSDGTLRRYRWNGTSWDTFAGGEQHEVIDLTGWDRYFTAEYRNRITVDTEGHIYTVEPDGFLHWRSYDPTADIWTHRTIDSGWNKYDLIIAAGRGIIYARTPGGILYRYRYHAASQRWLDTGRLVGRDWQTYDRVLSAGADVLYGIKPNGDMFWYRWNENTQAWVSLTGKKVGSGWIDWATTAAPDACTLVGTTSPTRPTAPLRPHRPVTLQYTTNGDVHYTYVDGEGRAVHAGATDVSSGTPIGFAAVPGFTGVTGITSTGEYQDGRVQLVAAGTDSEVRSNVQTAVRGPWTGTTTLGGFVPGPAAIVRQADNTLLIFALDAANDLWLRRQAGVNGPFDAWIRVGTTPLTPGRLTLVATASGVRILGLDQNGTFQTTTYAANSLGTWTSLGGSGFTGTLSAVAMPDATLQVFATNAGTVQTQRQAATGFPGSWTPLAGLTAAGSPSAILTPDGTLQLVARADDGYAYYTGQVAPGSSEYTPWREITNYTEQTSTDPTALAVPEENTWVVGYLNDLDTPKLRRYQPPTARTATPFIDVPLDAPASQ